MNTLDEMMALQPIHGNKGNYATYTLQHLKAPNIGITNRGEINDVAAGLQELSLLHQKLLVNLGEINSGAGNDPVRQQPTAVVDRPWVNPPEGHVPFDEASVIALGAVGATVTILTIVVPDGYDGVINAFSWNCTFGGFVQGSGDLKVQILRNGAPIKGFDNILIEKGSIGIPRIVSPIRIYSKQVITVTINHVANAMLAGNVVASLVGYYYPALG